MSALGLMPLIIDSPDMQSVKISIRNGKGCLYAVAVSNTSALYKPVLSRWTKRVSYASRRNRV